MIRHWQLSNSFSPFACQPKEKKKKKKEKKKRRKNKNKKEKKKKKKEKKKKKQAKEMLLLLFYYFTPAKLVPELTYLSECVSDKKGASLCVCLLSLIYCVQGDQVGRIILFAMGSFFEKYRISPHFCAAFPPSIDYVLINNFIATVKLTQ
jgi:hypothetical protein